MHLLWRRVGKQLCVGEPIRWLILLCSCVPIGECAIDEECTLPKEFAIQSDCPIASICIYDECRIGCPVPTEEPKKCLGDRVCDRLSRGNRTLECICHDGACYSVED